MSHYDCDYCNQHMSYCEPTCKRFDKPPEGIMPKVIWQHIRAQNLRDAIKRYEKAGIVYPGIWLNELKEIENG